MPVLVRYYCGYSACGLSHEKRLVLAADASTLSTRFTVLAISVVYRGVGIPVAWKIVVATEPGSWKPHWLELFDQIKNAVESDWFVIVATDRGLYADWLYNQIQSVGWHPFMRINQQGQFQYHGQKEWCLLTSLVPKVGDHWKGLVTCFKTNSIKCTRIGRWDEGYTDTQC